jgi:hypothetical protein
LTPHQTLHKRSSRIALRNANGRPIVKCIFLGEHFSSWLLSLLLLRLSFQRSMRTSSLPVILPPWIKYASIQSADPTLRLLATQSRPVLASRPSNPNACPMVPHLSTTRPPRSVCAIRPRHSLRIGKAANNACLSMEQGVRRNLTCIRT